MPGRRRHLRDAATICPATLTAGGKVLVRCELDAGHDGRHKSGCTSWGNPTTITA